MSARAALSRASAGGGPPTSLCAKSQTDKRHGGHASPQIHVSHYVTHSCLSSFLAVRATNTRDPGRPTGGRLTPVVQAYPAKKVANFGPHYLDIGHGLGPRSHVGLHHQHMEGVPSRFFFQKRARLAKSDLSPLKSHFFASGRNNTVSRAARDFFSRFGSHLRWLQGNRARFSPTD